MHDKRTKQLELNSKNISGLVGRDLIKPFQREYQQNFSLWSRHYPGTRTMTSLPMRITNHWLSQNTLIGMDKQLGYIVWSIFSYHSHCMANIKHLISCLNNELECTFTELFGYVTISLCDKQYFLTKAFMLALMMFTLLWNAFISLRYLENVVKGTTSVDLYVMNVIQVNNVMQSM